MRKNVNTIAAGFTVSRFFEDGTKIKANVDNFPVDCPAYKKTDGFRCNDVSLLDRISFDLNIDTDLTKIIASRVKELPKEPESTLNDDQKMATLRPAWVQTASEIKRFDEQVYQYLNTTADISLENVDVHGNDVESSSDSSVDNSSVDS